MRSIKKHDISLHIKASDSGEEALRFLKARSESQIPWPELIFLDIGLPGMGGYEFLRKFRDLYPVGKHDSIVCILTTSSHPRDKEGFSNLGIQEYLNKPLTPTNFNDIYQKYFA